MVIRINPHWLEIAQADVYDLDPIARFTENRRRSGACHSLSEYYNAAYGRAVGLFREALCRKGVLGIRGSAGAVAAN